MSEQNLRIAILFLVVLSATCYYFYYTETIVSTELTKTLSRTLDGHFQANVTNEKLNIVIQELNGKIKSLEEQKKVADAGVALEKVDGDGLPSPPNDVKTSKKL
ncbi:hypothetical protein HELRODRAFT_166437 [Helobdella robusta]|uniref:Uncharacterized protein n=1 Tax=Helobdella robusta TaxID=6412 RepID=T1EY48_HELRO|nr:hypothetical protein HELRODRAFT_166437 [Helobdella robusta]ESN90735.1 hypothetical protein HELRODRAFT_166437 [Helobdella robusta]